MRNGFAAEVIGFGTVRARRIHTMPDSAVTPADRHTLEAASAAAADRRRARRFWYDARPGLGSTGRSSGGGDAGWRKNGARARRRRLLQPYDRRVGRESVAFQSGILGDISPKPGTEDHVASKKGSGGAHRGSAVDGSQHDRTQHAGSRDVTEGVTGGLGTEVGGTRNSRQGTGHTGGDIGNQPE